MKQVSQAGFTIPSGHRFSQAARFRSVLPLLLLFLALPLASASPLTNPPLQPHADGYVLVKPSKVSPRADLEALQNNLAAKTVRSFPMIGGWQLWRLGPGISVPTAVRECLDSDLVEAAEPDYLVFATETPNDPSFEDGSLWHLDNPLQNGSNGKVDIRAREAWSIRNDAEPIIVAILDTGMRLTHEDLRSNLWRNPDEIEGNGIDDDENGYIDDVHGINAILDSGTPHDDAGHGTHVAGIIGAQGNNSVGTVGVAWNIRLMPLRFLDRFGEGTISDAVQCINYAIAHGAQVINNSWGTNAFSGALNGAMSLALQADVLIVAAAGNERRNNDIVPIYPANYNQRNILSVAASTRRDGLASYSNYGAGSVDLAAPGDAILSAWSHSDRAYEVTSGTSMSTPMVSGAAALVRAHFPQLTASEIAERLIATADPLPALRRRCVSEGRLNLALALGPDLIAGFSMSPQGGAPPLNVTFEDRSLGDVTDWSWDFGDGQTASGLANPSHTYNRAGNFPVTLRIQSSDGFSVTRTQGLPIVANYRVELDFFNWIEPSSFETLQLADDAHSPPIPLPFLFPFYARAHDNLYVASNGLIGFAPDELDVAENQTLPDASLPNGLISPFWIDLDPTQGGEITYGTTGDAPHRKFAVTYDRIRLKSGGGGTPLTFQVVLEESTQRIVFQYAEIDAGNLGGANATVGLENAEGFLAAKFQFNGGRHLRDEQTIAFTPLASNGMIVGPERDLRIIRELDGSTAQALPEFQLLNTGTALIGWQAAADQDWLRLSRTQGVLGAGQAVAVEVWIDPTAANFAPGSYFAQVQFSNVTSGTGSVARQVQLIVNGGEADWTLTPATSLVTSGAQGGPFAPLSRIYTLTNTGNRLVRWIADHDATWLTIEPQTGLLGAGDSVSLSARFNPSINNLRPGTYEETIVLKSESQTFPPHELTARVIVEGDASALVLLPDDAQLTSTTLSGPTTAFLAEYSLTNRGGRDTRWTLDSSEDWLIVSPQAGRLPPNSTERIELRLTPNVAEALTMNPNVELTLNDLDNPNSTPAKRRLTITYHKRAELLLSTQLINNQIEITLSARANTRYQVETSFDLKSWTTEAFLETSDTGLATFSEPLTQSPVPHYFRFTLAPIP